MAKLTLNELTSLQSEKTALQQLNDNFTKIASAVENTLSRDGTLPNALSGQLDMNSQRLLNLPAPISQTEPVRLADIGGIVPADIAKAGTYAAQAASSAQAAAASATAAAGYVGAATQAPKWSTARRITMFGDVSGTSPYFDGSADVTWSGMTLTDGVVTGAKMSPTAVQDRLGYVPLSTNGGLLNGDVRLNFTAISTLYADSIGFRGIPINNVNAADYVLTLNDVGRMVRFSGGLSANYYLDTTSNVPYPVGAVIAVRNVGAQPIFIKPGPGVSILKSGSSTPGIVTVAQWGMVTAVHEDPNSWVVTGTGIS